MNKHDEHTNTSPLRFEKRVLNRRYWFLAESQQWILSRGTRSHILEQNEYAKVKIYLLQYKWYKCWKISGKGERARRISDWVKYLYSYPVYLTLKISAFKTNLL